MRGRQKGQTKVMSKIKDPVISPYEVFVEEDQYVLVNTDRDKPIGYFGNLEGVMHRLSHIHLASQKEEYTLAGFIESYNNIKNQITKIFKI